MTKPKKPETWKPKKPGVVLTSGNKDQTDRGSEEGGLTSLLGCGSSWEDVDLLAGLFGRLFAERIER